MNFHSQIPVNDINHGYRTAILKKKYLWLLPFYMVSLLISIIKRCAERCALQLYQTSLRNNVSALIHIVRKRHFIYKGLFFFLLISRLQFTLKTSASYLAQGQRFTYFINSQDKIFCVQILHCLHHEISDT